MKYIHVDMPVELQQLAFRQSDEVIGVLLARLTVELDDVNDRHAVAYTAIVGAITKLLRLEKQRLQPCELVEFQPLFDQVWQLIRDERKRIRNHETGELN